MIQETKELVGQVKHVKLIGLCLLAVFALAAVAASAAQAEGPEWGRCVKLAKDKGKYKDANCQELEGKTNGKGVFKAKAKGFYEWVGNANTTCYEEPGKKGKYKNNTCTELEGKTKKGVFTPEEKGKYEKVTGGTKFIGEAGAAVLHNILAECYDSSEELVLGPRKDCLGSGYTWFGAPKIECTSQLATGEAAGTDEVVNVSVRFKGCTIGAGGGGGNPAETKGLPAGEIQVNPLKGRLGYINKAKHEVGVLLEPVAKGGTFAEFEAASASVAVTVGVGNATTGSFYEAFNDQTPGTPNGNDGVISPITPVNQMTHTLTQNYRISVQDEECGEISEKYCTQPGEEFQVIQNEPSHFEGGPLEVLESVVVAGGEDSSAWSPAGQEETNVNTLEGEDEIKA